MVSLGATAPTALGSETVLPVRRVVDDTHTGKPDDIGDGIIYLKPQDVSNHVDVEVGGTRNFVINSTPFVVLVKACLSWRIWL